MNFNLSSKPDYSLNTKLIDEMIRLYGTCVKFRSTEKIQDRGNYDRDRPNPEAAVFDSFKSLKTSKYTFERDIWVLMAEPEGYSNGLAMAFNQFGLINDDTMQVYVSIGMLDFLNDGNGVHPGDVVSNVLEFPNGKWMEITDCQLHVPGVNNAFVYSDQPSCYQLSLKSFNFDRSATRKTSRADEDKTLDTFFERQYNKQLDIKDAAEAEVLTEEDYRETTKKMSKIDDVFGTY